MHKMTKFYTDLKHINYLHHCCISKLKEMFATLEPENTTEDRWAMTLHEDVLQCTKMSIELSLNFYKLLAQEEGELLEPIPTLDDAVNFLSKK